MYSVHCPKSVIECLSELERIEEGSAIALDLKHKYWDCIRYYESGGIISPLKNKLEISQRFYFSEGQTGISVDEAYRFYKTGGWRNKCRPKENKRIA